MNKNNTFNLGPSITQLIPFYRQRQPEQQPNQQKEIITTKFVITVVIIAILRIAVLILRI
jgi:hypothetical protein